MQILLYLLLGITVWLGLVPKEYQNIKNSIISPDLIEPSPSSPTPSSHASRSKSLRAMFSNTHPLSVCEEVYEVLESNGVSTCGELLDIVSLSQDGRDVLTEKFGLEESASALVLLNLFWSILQPSLVIGDRGYDPSIYVDVVADAFDLRTGDALSLLVNLLPLLLRKPAPEVEAEKIPLVAWEERSAYPSMDGFESISEMTSV